MREVSAKNLNHEWKQYILGILREVSSKPNLPGSLKIMA